MKKSIEKLLRIFKKDGVQLLRELVQDALESGKDLMIEDAYLHIELKPSLVMTGAQAVHHAVNLVKMLRVDVELKIEGKTIRIKKDMSKRYVLKTLKAQGLEY